MDLSEQPSSDVARHPWERARAEFFVGMCEELGLLGVDRILDGGAGDGWLADQLVPRTEAQITCWDIYYSDADLEAIGTHGARVERRRDKPEGPYDLVLLLDVLEHVEDDVGFLRDVTAMMRPGAHMLISVPGWPALFSEHDRMLRHYRRYRPGQAARLLEESGLSIVREGGLFHSLLPVRAAQRARELLRAGAGGGSGDHELDWRHGAGLTSVIMNALRADNALARFTSARGVRLPGLSWWAACRFEGVR